MFRDHRVIALIPARGGSKSMHYKNLRELGGRSLLAWAVGVGKGSKYVDRIILSTDDERIAKAGRELDIEIYMRPAELATDTALVADVIRHLWATLKSEGEAADIMVLLECTSPFRSSQLVDRCIARLVDDELDSLATFQEASLNPERAWRLVDGLPQPFIEGTVPWKPRQTLTPAYQLTGAVYAFRPDRLPPGSPSILFGRFGAEIVHDEPAIDIDTEQDLRLANALLDAQ
jgi:CMP-N,N'-diacetyllegionaminic acid synthase